MKYITPKNAVIAYEYQTVTIPEAAQYWSIHIKSRTPEPEVKPDNHTGPRGRLKWIRDVSLDWHHVTPSAEYEHTRMYRLCENKGWHGITIYRISAFEEQRIKAFIETIDPKDHHKCRPEMLECRDERAGDIGDHMQRHRGYYFSSKALYDECVAMLEAIPRRTIEMYIDRKLLNKNCRMGLRGLNWHINVGQDADLLTIEESVSSAALMTIKLTASVAKPPGESVRLD